MPLIAFAVGAYAAGLATGFGTTGAFALIVAGGVAAALFVGRRGLTGAALALVFATGVIVARDAPEPAPTRPDGMLARWRSRTGATIDALYGDDAPVVRALLIADTRQLPRDVRDRYARAGLVHLLSISGLHVGIISGAVLLGLRALRLRIAVARWLAAALTVLYVVAIGAPPPALRSGSMLAARTIGWVLQRPVSPWATLALGALVPLLVNPRDVTNLGYQLSVGGFASVTAAGVWIRRWVAPRLDGRARRLASEVIVATMAAFASAPLVAWHFARVSLIAPVANLVAAPVVALMQPALFLSLATAPAWPVARLFADGAAVLVRAVDLVAARAAAVPGGSVAVAPSLAAAVIGVATSVCVLGAASARRRAAPWIVGAATGVAALAWSPMLPAGNGAMEVHAIDVGQGDAIAIRTPAGRWMVIDAGGGRATGDAGRRVVLPYLRRRGGDVALFVMTHPHDDHVGGAAGLVSLLQPADVRDGAFAGTSPSYREALVAARAGGVRWTRVRPGDSLNVDGVVATFLAPDSAWTAGLTDPNLASVVVLVRYGKFRALFTGDAEAPEEAWLVSRGAASLRADVLKVAHHGSRTSSTPAFLDAVRPQVALVSVGAANRYHHPSPLVLADLQRRGIRVARTDELGTVVVRTNRAGDRFEVVSAGQVVYAAHAGPP